MMSQQRGVGLFGKQTEEANTVLHFKDLVYRMVSQKDIKGFCFPLSLSLSLSLLVLVIVARNFIGFREIEQSSWVIASMNVKDITVITYTRRECVSIALLRAHTHTHTHTHTYIHTHTPLPVTYVLWSN